MTEEKKEWDKVQKGSNFNKYPECSQCGICKGVCPTFLCSLKETNSPRARAIMMKKESPDESFYNCNLCGACREACPINIKLSIRKSRADVVDKKKETAENKQMIENVRKYGNPFGKIEKGKKPTRLYCC